MELQVARESKVQAAQVPLSLHREWRRIPQMACVEGALTHLCPHTEIFTPAHDAVVHSVREQDRPLPSR